MYLLYFSVLYCTVIYVPILGRALYTCLSVGQSDPSNGVTLGISLDGSEKPQVQLLCFMY